SPTASASGSSTATSASSGTGWRPASSASRRKGGSARSSGPCRTSGSPRSPTRARRPRSSWTSRLPSTASRAPAPAGPRRGCAPPSTAGSGRTWRSSRPARPAGRPSTGKAGTGSAGAEPPGTGRAPARSATGARGPGASAESAGEQKADDRPGGGHGVVAEVAGQGAAEPEVGEAVDDRPGGDRGGPVGAPPAGPLAVALAVRRDAADAPGQHAARAVAGGGDLGVVLPVQPRAEDHLEVRPVVDGEADVGQAHLVQVVPGGLEGVGEQRVAPGGDGREQPRLVAEVVGGRGVRDARAARQLAQAPAGRARLRDRLDRRVEDDAPQVAVVVGAAPHGRHPI